MQQLYSDPKAQLLQPTTAHPLAAQLTHLMTTTLAVFLAAAAAAARPGRAPAPVAAVPRLAEGVGAAAAGPPGLSPSLPMRPARRASRLISSSGGGGGAATGAASSSSSLSCRLAAGLAAAALGLAAAGLRAAAAGFLVPAAAAPVCWLICMLVAPKGAGAARGAGTAR